MAFRLAQLHDTTFCFLSSHMQAFQEEVQNRNNDFANLVDGLLLGSRGGRNVQFRDFMPLSVQYPSTA